MEGLRNKGRRLPPMRLFFTEATHRSKSQPAPLKKLFDVAAPVGGGRKWGGESKNSEGPSRVYKETNNEMFSHLTYSDNGCKYPTLIRAGVMCDCDSRTRDLCSGLTFPAVTTSGLDIKQPLNGRFERISGLRTFAIAIGYNRYNTTFRRLGSILFVTCILYYASPYNNFKRFSSRHFRCSKQSTQSRITSRTFYSRHDTVTTRKGRETAGQVESTATTCLLESEVMFVKRSKQSRRLRSSRRTLYVLLVSETPKLQNIVLLISVTFSKYNYLCRVLSISATPGEMSGMIYYEHKRTHNHYTIGVDSVAIHLGEFQSVCQAIDNVAIHLGEFLSVSQAIDNVAIHLGEFLSVSQAIDNVAIHLGEFQSVSQAIDNVAIHLGEFLSVSQAIDNVAIHLGEFLSVSQAIDNVAIHLGEFLSVSQAIDNVAIHLGEFLSVSQAIDNVAIHLGEFLSESQVIDNVAIHLGEFLSDLYS
ncbi:hypothetical protein J6590_064557 [Homalodisca vitripennis]|nr:hypothetical protein J6590_064557 [Homalodisca vitripennis]